MKTRLIMLAACVVASAACSKEFVPENLVPFSLNVNIENEDGSQDSKLSLELKKFIFEIGDTLALHTDKTASGNCTPLVYSGAGTFTGNVKQSELDSDFFITYPYSSKMYMKSDWRIVEIPFSNFQTAVKDGLPRIGNLHLDPSAPGKPIALLYGKTSTTEGVRSVNLSPKNAYLKFTLETSNVAEIHFYMQSDPIAAQKVLVHTDNYAKEDFAKGSFKSQDGRGETTVIVVKPQGSTFEAGTYYIAALPQNYKVGYYLIRNDGKYASVSSGDTKFDVEAGKIHQLRKNKALDNGVSWKSAKTDEIEIEYDFENNEYGLPSALTKGSYGEIKSGDYKTSVKSDNGYMRTQVEGKYCLFLAAESNSGSRVPYIQTPSASLYTVKKAVVEFAKVSGTPTETIYFGKGDPNQCYMTLNQQKIAVGNDLKASVMSQYASPYSRYYLLFQSSASTSKEPGLSGDGAGYYIKKITFTMHPYSWTGSWN